MSDSFVTPRTAAHQVPLSTEFPRQEYWSGFPFPAPGDPPDPRIEPVPTVLAGGFATEPPGGPLWHRSNYFFVDCTYFEVNHSGILIVLVLQWLYVNLSVSITNNRNQSSTGKEFMVAQLVKNSPAKAGDMGSIPRSGRSPGEGHGNHCFKWCFKWYFGA